MRGPRLSQEDVFRWRIAIGEAIRHARESRKLTQADLASELEWARATVAAIERGRQGVSCDQLLQLASLFGLEVTELLPVVLFRPGSLRLAS